MFCVTNCVRQLQCLHSWYSIRHSAPTNSNKCVYNSENAGRGFIVFDPLDMKKTFVGMAIRTALLLFLFFFVQGLSADTLLKRDSTPTESENVAEENIATIPEESSSEVLQETDSDILAKLQENKQEFYNKIKELSDNLSELKKQGSGYLETLKGNKQKLSDIIKVIAANLTSFEQQNSKLLNRLQNDKQNFEDKIREIISQQDSAEDTIPLEINSEFLVKLNQIKQKVEKEINQLKSETREKIQELRDKLQAQGQNGASKRDLSDALSGDSVISILLSVPTSLASSFQNKFSEFKEDADQVFKNFAASLGGSLDVLENLQSVVNSSVLAKVSDIGEIASAASSCFQTQEGAVESLIKQTEIQIENSLGADHQKIEATVDRIRAIGTKVQDLIIQTARNSTKCFISLECVAGLGSIVVSLISDINDEISSEVANMQSFKEEVLPGVADTVSTLVQTTLSQAADIAQTTIKCIEDATSTA